MEFQMSKYNNLLLIVIIIGLPVFIWWWGESQYDNGYNDSKNRICEQLKERSARLADDICN
tara:strand:+ start:125 stop:307 length:183 start_codon:yes stop_codon:yes gene_type:complete